MDKLITIIVPCYNQAHFLEETLASVLNQTYLHWECIIVNDGSKDNTELVSKQWVAKDARFKYFFKDNGGLSSARNYGLDNAKGDYIVFLDSDDCIAETKFEDSLNIADAQDLDLVISDFAMFYKKTTENRRPFCELKSQELSYKSIVLNWDSKFAIAIHCGFFSRDLFKTLRFSEALKAKEDWLMWIAIFKQEPKVLYLDKVLAFYRKNPKSMTSNMSHMRTNLNKAYKQIYISLTPELQSFFLDKIVSDNSRSIINYDKKYLKYKKVTHRLIMLSLALILALIVAVLFV